MEGSVSKSILELPPRSGNELNEGGKEEKEGGTGIGDKTREPSCEIRLAGPHRPGRMGFILHKWYGNPTLSGQDTV